MNRRDFLQNTAALCALPSLADAAPPAKTGAFAHALPLSRLPLGDDSLLQPIDLKPARWIWYPMERCLPSTVVLLRREITLESLPSAATGQILADSRYKLTVN